MNTREIDLENRVAELEERLKKEQRFWLERKLDEYNHIMELIRTIVPFLILFVQIIILFKLFL
jgi:hypothetical protein